jgi:hypothetical protein
LEFIAELDDGNMLLFVHMFKAKIINNKGAEATWAFHIVRLIEKKMNTIRLDQFRPIAILPTVYKWFSIVLMLLAGPSLFNLKAPQFAFRSTFHVTECTFILNNVIEKAKEFDFPLFIADGDVRKAYDFTEYGEVLKGGIAAGVHKALIAAWLRELANMATVFAIASRTSSDRVQRVRSLIQGDPAAPPPFQPCY